MFKDNPNVAVGKSISTAAAKTEPAIARPFQHLRENTGRLEAAVNRLRRTANRVHYGADEMPEPVAGSTQATPPRESGLAGELNNIARDQESEIDTLHNLIEMIDQIV